MGYIVDISVIQACRTLFGGELAISPGFLESLDPGRVKGAFRKRALETHPDRFVALDPISAQLQTMRFVEVTAAYRRLNDFIDSRKHRDKTPADEAPQTEPRYKPAFRQPFPSRFYSGPLPRRSLLFGEYLYYTGNIPQQVLINALLWQRGLRPRFGDIALRWRLLSTPELQEAVRSRRFGEPLGEAAVRVGLLSRFQVNAVLYFQRKLQRPIGEYFIANGHIMNFTLRRLLDEQRKYNEQYMPERIFRKVR
jgi:hypothetical protein